MKLKALKKAGPGQLTLLSDYDQTLTRAKFSDGSACDSTFKTVIMYPGTPENVREVTLKLYKRYHPIEKDQSLCRAEKLHQLEDWWRRDMQAFVSAGYTKDDFAEMTKNSKL